jgi:hypothetical protein
MSRVTITNGSEVPASFGTIRKAVKKLTVGIREPNGEEKFKLSWGELTAVPGVDVVIVAAGEEYPCKKEIFDKTYEEVSPGRYRKTATSSLVQVPEGVTAALKTLEGDVEVQYPDYVAIGPKNEVYANAQAWVNDNLDFVS